MSSELDRLRHEEQQAWNELTAYIDFTNKCKARVYTGRKPYSPTPVHEVEAEFTRLVRRWEGTLHRLREYRNPTTLPAYNGTRPEADGTRRRKLNSQSAT